MHNVRTIFAMAMYFICAAFSVGAGDADPNAPIDTAKYKEKIKVACIGDSITQGVGSKVPWPAILQKMLGDKWEVKNYGISARTMLKKGDNSYHKEKKYSDAQNYKPDVVVIMLGTNDTKPQNWKFKDEFVADYKDMIAKFTSAEPKPRVFVCRPPYVPGKGNFGINEAGVLEQIGMIDGLAKETGAGIIDMHAALKDKDAMLPDKVHPNTDGAIELAKAAYGVLMGKAFEGELKLEGQK